MVLSIGFSTVLYMVSASELNKQLEPPASQRVHIQVSGRQGGEFFNVNPSQRADNAALAYLRQRVAQSKRELVYKLALLNAGMFLVGTGLSFLLARRTLRPIEAAMRAQSQFASNASHELRTPLSAMRVEIEEGLRSLTLTPPTKRLLESNLEELDHLTQLSDGLLRLAREADEIELNP
ncbi:MAG TPA: histidine kinase dimerization/phospho-acceptor domain-containing protein, partial [Ktedonobacteraceae bacterium]|nr:histidine kinase dimerization/phospho-acceptor domain-containing protein [Ktedonobacteraceae bacterium]